MTASTFEVVVTAVLVALILIPFALCMNEVKDVAHGRGDVGSDDYDFDI